MPPQRRRKCQTLDVVEEQKNGSKRQKTNNLIMSSEMRHNPRRSLSRDYDDSGFSQKKCLALFKEFASLDSDLIEPEGVERFCQALQVEPEDVVMLVVAWKMDAKQMGFFTLQEWLKGLTDIQCDSISKIRYKLDYLRKLLNDPSTFKSIYRYAFDFAKDKDQRSIDIETAKAMLQLLLANHWSLYNSFYQFLEQSKYKVLNKDQWCNVLEFSRSISPDLKNYDEDGAWPVLLDEFVDWLRKNAVQ